MVQKDKAKNKDKKKSEMMFKLAVLRYHRLIIVGSILIIALASYYFVLGPKYEQVRLGGRFNLDTLSTEFNKRQEYLDQLKRLAESYEKINQSDIDKLEKILPRESDIAGIFVQLEDLALDNDFLLRAVNIKEVPDPISSGSTVANKIKKLNISLTLLGNAETSYESLKQLLSAMEENLRLIDVNAVFFVPNSSEFSVNAYTYYQAN